MVDLELARCAAILAAPPTAREHLAISVGFKAQSRPLRFELLQRSPSPFEELQPPRHGKNAGVSYGNSIYAVCGWMTVSPSNSKRSKSRSRCKSECPCLRQNVAITQSIVLRTVYLR